uniref:glutamate synthase-related protein n=1 Tax=Nocardia brasiliensis TaxID=37326 RepID=UPI00245909C1
LMMAIGCIQAQRCHTNHCPVGVATQDPRRARALDVADKTERVRRVIWRGGGRSQFRAAPAPTWALGGGAGPPTTC